MKVLGITSDGFILQIDKQEMAVLLGKGESVYNCPDEGLKPGTTIKLSQMYSNAREILDAYAEIGSSVKSIVKTSTKLMEHINSKENPIAAKSQN